MAPSHTSAARDQLILGWLDDQFLPPLLVRQIVTFPLENPTPTANPSFALKNSTSTGARSPLMSPIGFTDDQDLPAL